MANYGDIDDDRNEDGNNNDNVTSGSVFDGPIFDPIMTSWDCEVVQRLV